MNTMRRRSQAGMQGLTRLRRQSQSMRWRVRADTLNRRVSDNEGNFMGRALAVIQKFSLPLLVGVVAALVFANAYPTAYSFFVGADHHGKYLSLAGDWHFLGHPITFYFLVNDIFMVFFFGLAAKEVTEALLPGGSLNPPSKVCRASVYTTCHQNISLFATF
mmetsp:Transcript_5789/g.13572  ORF Transcript_5789/g.13572 Transcript_5789/m.13572 type:complete len:162 (-) Transcript_5789:1182-1667(-)